MTESTSISIPEAAQQRLLQLYSSYTLSRQDLTCFYEGLLLGMGLNPDDWELNTTDMSLLPRAARSSNGTAH